MGLARLGEFLVRVGQGVAFVRVLRVFCCFGGRIPREGRGEGGGGKGGAGWRLRNAGRITCFVGGAGRQSWS